MTPQQENPSPGPPGSRGADAPGAAGLHGLGPQTDTARAVRRILPWILSAAAHAAMIVAGFLVTWTVVMLTRDEPPALVVADFDAVTYEPLLMMSPDEAPADELLVQDRVRTDEVEDRLEETLDPEVSPPLLPTEPQREAAPPVFDAPPVASRATFVGLSTTNALRVVYVIDASGSMIRSFPIVVDELARSLDGLGPEQEFTVICFSGGHALMPPPETRLIRATEEEKIRVLSWIRDVIPASRSNPLEALDRALSLKPDVVFLLSENITGSGQFEIDQGDLLARLDELNPVDPDSGRRAAQINCVQFLDPDPLGTLEKIAREHGGPKGYKFLDREELGLRGGR